MDKFEIGKKYMFDNSGIIEIIDVRGNYYYFKIISGLKSRDLLRFTKVSDFASHLSLYEEKKKTFTKADLHNGDVVVKRDGSVNIVCFETGTLICKNGFNKLISINDDLTYNGYGSKEFDIIKVYRPNEAWQCQFDESGYTKGSLVFDRERDIKPKFDRQKWIDDMKKRFMIDGEIKFGKLDVKSIIVYNVTNPNKNGVSTCKHSDVFNMDTGITVAYAKYLGEPIPKEI